MGEYLENQYDEREYALELAKKHKLLPEDNSNLTWEELKEKAKGMGYILVKKVPINVEQECLVNSKGYGFYVDGVCEFDCKMCDNLCGSPFAWHRTPDQMFAIMKALQ